MLYYRQVPNLSQTNLNEIYASQTASIERGGHPDMEFLQYGHLARNTQHCGFVLCSQAGHLQEVVGSDRISCFRNGQHSELSCSRF